MSDRREPTPADRRRPTPEDGVLRQLYWYGWVLFQYAKVFSIGTVAVLASIIGFAAARSVFVPEYVTEPTFGWALGIWSVATLAIFVMWARSRMARAGIESE